MNGADTFVRINDNGEHVDDDRGALLKPLAFVNKNALENSGKEAGYLSEGKTWEDLTELERNTVIQDYDIDLAEFDFDEVLNSNIIVVHTENELALDRMVLRISDKIGQLDQTDQNVNLSFSVNLINDTPVVVVNHPQETGFVNTLMTWEFQINPQVVFPEGTVKLIDNDDPNIASLTVKIRNPENGDLLLLYLRTIP